MVTGMLTVLSHVGAIPLILIQDILAVRTILQRKPFHWGRWIVSRIGIYGVFLMTLWLVHLRQLTGKVISSGQPYARPARFSKERRWRAAWAAPGR